MLREIQKGAIVVFQRSWWNEIPLITGTVLVTICCIYLALQFPNTNITVDFSPLFNDYTARVAPLMIIPLTLLCVLLHRRLDDRYVLTEDELISVDGLCSFKVTYNQINLAHIRGLEIEQSLMQRILGTGNVLVGTASLAEHEVILQGVRSPEYYQSIIQTMVKEQIDNTKALASAHTTVIGMD